jgi:hypothetical protein
MKTDLRHNLLRISQASREEGISYLVLHCQLGMKKTDISLAPPSMPSNVRDRRRRAVGALLADGSQSAPDPVPASGVTTRDDRCIA